VCQEKIRSRCGAAGGWRAFEASGNISAASVYSLGAMAPMLGIDGLIGATAETSQALREDIESRGNNLSKDE
jgi:hypothetical protein